MHLANLFSNSTRWKCFVYSTFATVCFAQSGPGTRGGPADFSSQLRSATLTAQTSTSIKYVQGNYATPQTPQTTVSVTFTGPQAATDLNVVVVGWNDSTAVVNTVTDKNGNRYTRAIGPTVRSGSSHNPFTMLRTSQRLPPEQIPSLLPFRLLRKPPIFGLSNTAEQI